MGKTPIEIIHDFFKRHAELSNEEEQVERLFKFVQYIERQVVLFDSIEDAAPNAAYLIVFPLPQVQTSISSIGRPFFCTLNHSCLHGFFMCRIYLIQSAHGLLNA